MAIVAYASGVIDPTLNPNADPIIDLSDPLVTLPQSVQLYGDCIDDSGDPGPFSYSWTIMSNLPGSTVSLVDPNLQNPTVQDVDVWGNVRLFVVATNTSTAETSETDPLRAPSSAFVVIRVLSEKQTIQKPAAGERNWMDDVWTWAQRIEDFAASSLAPHAIIDHTDVTDATGFDLEQLTGGGYAFDPEPGATGAPANPPDAFGNSILHRHYGSDVDVATIATPGTIYLDPGFVGDPTSPTAITNDFLMLSAHAWFGYDEVDGLVPNVVPGRTLGVSGLAPMFVFGLPPGVNGEYWLRDYSVAFNVAGPHPDRYQFDIVRGDGASPLTMTPIAGSDMTMPVLVDPVNQLTAHHLGQWSIEENAGSPDDIALFDGANRDFIGVRCISAPPNPDRAQGITVTLFLRRNT